jgi:hypothetical protein
MITPTQANQLTSYLYGLKTPEAVQQYAMQHQSDINVVGLASSVANAMKRAQGMQQPQQPQGTVAQQAVASMAQPQPQPMQPPSPMMPQAAQQLPETSGIAQLPAQNMQKMAGGGITGEPHGRMEGGTRRFDVAGQVPSTLDVIQQGNTAALQPLAQQFQQAQAQWMATLNSGDQQAINRAFQQKEALRLQLQQKSQNQLGGPQLYTSSINTPPPGITPTATTPAPGLSVPPYTLDKTRPNLADSGIAAAPNLKRPSAAPAGPAAPAFDANAQMNAATNSVFGAGASGAGQYDMSGLNSMLKNAGLSTMSPDETMAFVKKVAPVQDVSNHLDLKTNLGEVMDSAKAAGVDLDNSKGFAQLDKMSQKNEDMLDKKTNLAIMAAGFAMMSTPGSAFTAIGKGAEQGLGVYSQALDKYQDGAARLAESRIMLEKSKNEMGLGALKEAYGLQSNAQKLQFDGNKMQVDAFTHIYDTQGNQRAELARSLLAAQSADKVEQMRARTSIATTGMQTAAQQDIERQRAKSAIDVEGMRAASQEKIWGARAASGIERAQIMADARNHPKFTEYYKAAAASAGPGAPLAQIEAMAAGMMERHGLVGAGGGGGGAGAGVGGAGWGQAVAH